MAAPTLLTAMQNLKTLLGTIDGTSGYTTTVKTVEQKARMWHRVDDSERPYIGIQLRTGLPEYHNVRQVLTDSEVMLVTHFPDTDDEDQRLIDQLEFLDDVYQATDSDITLGGCLIGTTVGPWEVDSPDDLSTHSMVITLTLRYRRGTGAS
jgi:hypothetical protein